MKLKGAIFDLDGTLLDSMYIWDSLGDDYLKSKGKLPEPGLKYKLKTMSLNQSARYFQEAYGIKDDECRIISDIAKLIENQYFHSIPAKPFAKELLDNLFLNGVKMCIVTATEKTLAEAALKRLELDRFFSTIITCTESGFGKDQPEIFLKALEVLGTEIYETVVFEDALHAVKTAKAAGFKVAGVYDKSARADREEIMLSADWYIDSLDKWEVF